MIAIGRALPCRSCCSPGARSGGWPALSGNSTWRPWALANGDSPAVYLGVSVALAVFLREHLPWPRLHWLIALSALFGLLLVLAANDEYGAPLAIPTLLPWTIYLLALGWALWSARSQDARSLAVAHLAGLWTIGLALTLQLEHYMSGQEFSQGWEFLGMTAPLALLSLGLWRRAEILSWPCSARFESYRLGLVRTCDAVAGGGACLRLVPGW